MTKTQQTLTDKDAEIAKLRAELAAAKNGSRALKLKVSEKGAVSLYGMGRFPVTLYLEQWETLLGYAEEIRTFIDANRSSLKSKGD